MEKLKAELEYLVPKFELNFTPDSKLLTDWLATPTERLEDWVEATLSRIEPQLHLLINCWQTGDFQMKLLSPLLMLAEMEEPRKIGLFCGRPIEAEIDNCRFRITADCMTASVYGLTAPRAPYFFFLQQFKRKSRGYIQDTQGQMLAAMLAAQHLNQNGKPLYGSYVIGRDWFFTTLHDKNYTRSEALRLTQPQELRQVILTLRKLKQIILNDLMQ